MYNQTYRLRNVDKDYIFYSKDNYEVDTEIEDGRNIETCREEVWINKEHNQSIIFHEWRFPNEETLENISDIPNYISNTAYNYVSNVLDKYDNVTVVWSQIYGTTSDYTIIFDHCFTNREEVEKYISQHSSHKLSLYKYTEYVDNEKRICNM